MLRFPPPRFAAVLLARGTLIWLAVRLGAALTSGIKPSALAAVVIVAAATTLTSYDARRQGEHLFLANLGIPVTLLVAIAGTPALVFELIARLVLGGP